MRAALQRRTGTVLDRILAAKARALERHVKRVPLAAVRAAAEATGEPQDFRSHLAGPGVSLIAEMKRASPSGGELQADLDPAAMAVIYAESGAAAISVLTEADFFRGSVSDLRAAKAALAGLGVPVLLKDFVYDDYQVYEARVAGADAVLLIAAILDDDRLSALYALSSELGMGTLVEVFDEAELNRALDIGADIVGINNRNLRTLQTSLAVFERLAPRVPRGAVLVAESGMRGPEDVRRMAAAGADAVLVGEALMRAGGGVAELARRIAFESR